MRMKDIELKHKKELQIKNNIIENLENNLNNKRNYIICLNKEIAELSLVKKYNLNNIDIIVKQSSMLDYQYKDLSRIAIGINDNDKLITYATIIDNHIFKTLSSDKGKIITDVISRIIQNIFHEKGLI